LQPSFYCKAALRRKPIQSGVGIHGSLDLTRQAGFVVTVYDEDGLRLAATPPLSTPEQAFVEARKIVDNKVEGPRKQ